MSVRACEPADLPAIGAMLASLDNAAALMHHVCATVRHSSSSSKPAAGNSGSDAAGGGAGKSKSVGMKVPALAGGGASGLAGVPFAYVDGELRARALGTNHPVVIVDRTSPKEPARL